MIFEVELKKLTQKTVLIMVLLLFICSASSLIVEYNIKKTAAITAALSIREDILIGNYQKARSGFAAIHSEFSFIKYYDSELEKSFKIGEKGSVFSISLYIPLYVDDAKSQKHGYFLFYYSPLGSVLLSLSIWFFTVLIVFKLFSMNKIKLTNAYIRKIEMDKKENLVLITKQVAHDIRSPLSVLNLIIKSMPNNTDEKIEILRSASERINNIVEDILDKSKSVDFMSDTYSLVSKSPIKDIVNRIIKEKKIEYKNFEKIVIEFDDVEVPSVFVNISEKDFNRFFSNVINNAVESFVTQIGRILIRFSCNSKYFIVSVEDNGAGIPQEVLHKIGKQKISFGKSNSKASGNGLGLFHGVRLIESLGGQVIITSKVGLGTKVEILLPIAEK